MKNLLSILLVSIILMGCSENNVFKDDLEVIKGDYFSEEIVMTVYEDRKIWIKRFKKIGNKLKLSKLEDYYTNGQLESEKNYKDGKKDGLQRGWYENGQLEYEENYKDGKWNGLQRAWYENGQLKYEINYKDGNKDGLWRWFSYRDGQLEYEENYKDGEIID
jgi:antitoxin component YwqK of YwqJK toxin-antitoxin module